jgi:predicted HTH domain antitoxin
MRVKVEPMSSVKIEVEEPLAAILRQTNQPVQEAGREMIVLELYRRGSISSGKAAELLGMPRIDFIKHASRLGIPFFDMSEDEWEAEKAALKAL